MSSTAITVLHLASGNPAKLSEHTELSHRALLKVGLHPVKIVSPAEEGGMPPVMEDAGSFSGNAWKKASAVRERLSASSWVLADDSGLCVDALGGAPGVNSAVYAGSPGDDAANLAKLVAAMHGIPPEKRSAHFICVLALLGPGGVFLTFTGRCEGRLLVAPRGSGGFGYDPLFAPHGSDASFAELGEEVKNELSHRASAWDQFAAWLAQH